MAAIAAAQELDVSVRSVNRLYRRFVECGEAALKPAYEHCGQNPSRRASAKVLNEARQLRKDHPTWGAPLIRVILRRHSRRRELPCSRTLQRCFAREQVPPAPPGRRPALPDDRATKPHEVWEMDAVEELPLHTGREVSWLRIVDEFTAAVMKTKVYDDSSFGHVGARPVQAQLRRVFSDWGRPERFRVDNGVPWGSRGDFPTDVALWLIGLGIGIVWNKPRCPQQNPVVERFQGVGKRWAEPGGCRSAEELQQRLDEFDRLQREEYPYREDKSRLEVFPELKHSPRPYSRAWEREHWNHALVLEHLSEYLVTRCVDHGGKISIYNREYYVGKQHQGEAVSVMLDPQTVQWVILDEEGRQLRAHAAEQLTAERIVALDVTRRRIRPR